MSRQVCKEIIDHGVLLAARLSRSAQDGPGVVDALNVWSDQAGQAVAAVWGVPSAAPAECKTFDAAATQALTMCGCLLSALAFHGPAEIAVDLETVHKALVGALAALDRADDKDAEW